jgi:hypothetical protein
MAGPDRPGMENEEVVAMTFSERTVYQIRRVMKNTPGLSERHMYRGVTFMVKGNMCCGYLDEQLVVRLGPDEYEVALRQPHVHPMDFTGRPLPGFVFVDRKGFSSDRTLKQWIDRGMSFVSTLPPK